MAIIKLKQYEEYITFELTQAEAIVQEAKELQSEYELSSWSIIKKTKKGLDFYIVKVSKKFAEEKEILEGYSNE